MAAVFGATTNNDQIITLDQSLINVGGLTFNNSGTGTYTINSIGNNTLAFDNGGAGATVLLNNATNNNIISAPVALNSKVTADIAAGTQLTLTGQLAGATALNINPDSGNTGTLIISANNAGFLTAAITLNAGLVNFGAGSLGSGSITFAGTSTLQYASNNTQDISSQLQAIPSGVTATIDTGGNNVGFGTGLSGGGGLTKAGSGVLTLGGTNTYQGATLISGGGLAVNGSLAAASTVTVNANTTLGGSGTVNGPVIVQSGGHVAPSIGQFFAAGVTSNFGNGLTLNSGSVLDFNLSNVADGPGSAPPNSLNSSNDHIVVNGPLSLNGGTLNLNEYDNSLQVGTYELIGYSGVLNAPNGAAGWSVANQPAGFNFSFSVANPNQFDLVVTTGSGNATWSSNSNNSYNSPGNWTPSNVPSSPGQIAVIGTGTQGTVTINAGVTLGQLDFDDTGNPNSFTAYTLGGSGTLTLDNSGSGAGECRQQFESHHQHHAQSGRRRPVDDVQRRLRRLARRGRIDQRIGGAGPEHQSHRRRHAAVGRHERLHRVDHGHQRHAADRSEQPRGNSRRRPLGHRRLGNRRGGHERRRGRPVRRSRKPIECVGKPNPVGEPNRHRHV